MCPCRLILHSPCLNPDPRLTSRGCGVNDAPSDPPICGSRPNFRWLEGPAQKRGVQRDKRRQPFTCLRKQESPRQKESLPLRKAARPDGNGAASPWNRSKRVREWQAAKATSPRSAATSAMGSNHASSHLPLTRGEGGRFPPRSQPSAERARLLSQALNLFEVRSTPPAPQFRRCKKAEETASSDHVCAVSSNRH
jgi:hypothetical protein